MSTEVRITRDELKLLFLSIDRHEDFLETDKYFLFLHTKSIDGSLWYLFDVFDDDNTFMEFKKITLGKHKYKNKWVVFHKQKVVWTNVDNLGQNNETCPECGTKKIKYIGLGIGSSNVELICPKC